MTALEQIIKEAKSLRRKYPHRYKHLSNPWRDGYMKQASAIYASKHKGRSPVGKKKRVANVETKSKSHVDKNRMTTNIQIGGVDKIEAANKVLQLTKEISNTDKQIEMIRGYIRNMKRDPKGYGRNISPYKKQLDYLLRLKRTQQKNLSNYKRLL